MKALLVYRAPQFSPNSVEKDKAILEETGRNLLLQGIDVQYVDEERLMDCLNMDMILTMGRLPQTQERLAEAEEKGIPVINSAKALMRSSRGEIDHIMRSNAIPAPLLWRDGGSPTFPSGYWAKRADIAAQSKDDVQFAANEQELDDVLKTFQVRGVEQVLVTEHVVGDLVKFYGVEGTDFFHWQYASMRHSKFGLEKINGRPRGYDFDVQHVKHYADKLASRMGVPVYGGDVIISLGGKLHFIDFNDFPSFSSCRDMAAKAIAKRITQ